MLENDEIGENAEIQISKQKSDKENGKVDAEVHEMPLIDLKCDNSEPTTNKLNGADEPAVADDGDEKLPLTNGCSYVNGSEPAGHVENEENGESSKDSDEKTSEHEQKDDNEDTSKAVEEMNEAEPAKSTDLEDKEADSQSKEENSVQPEANENVPESSGEIELPPKPITPPPEITSTTPSTDLPEEEPAIQNILANCSPEKLIEIRRLINEKIGQTTTVDEPAQAEASPQAKISESAPTDPPTELANVDEEPKVNETSTHKRSFNEVKTDEGDCIVLSDSDDDVPQPPKKLRADSPVVNEKVSTSTPTSEFQKRSKPLPKRKECAYPDCPNPNNHVEKAANFALNILSIPIKKTQQYLCSLCDDKAFEMIEESACSLEHELPLKAVTCKTETTETVQIIDSDDEEEEPNLANEAIVPDEDLFEFDTETEEEAEKMILNLWSKFKIPNNCLKTLNNCEESLDKFEEATKQLDQDLKSLDRKSMDMYNGIYSINRPIYKNRPPIDINESGDATEIHKMGAIDIQNLRANMAAQALTQSVTISPINSPIAENNSSTLKSMLLQNVPQLVTISPVSAATPSSSSSNIPSTEWPASPVQIYFALRSSAPNKMQNWMLCKLVKEEIVDNKKQYHVHFDKDKDVTIVSGNQIAKNQVNLKLKVGARVLALFDRYDKTTGQKTGHKYSPGVIGERLTNYNRHRYLVFSDYGDCQYVDPKAVKEVIESPANVWEDVHNNLKKAIQDYLANNSCRRPLMIVEPGKQANFQIQRDGLWMQPFVLGKDCSLVNLRYRYQNQFFYEWVYRGSKRLSTMNRYMHTSHTTARRHADTNIEFVLIDEEGDDEDGSMRQSTDTVKIIPAEQVRVQRAKKSTSAIPQPVQPAPQPAQRQQRIVLNDPMIYVDIEPKDVARVCYFKPSNAPAQNRFVPHECSPGCLTGPKKINSYPPLAKPLVTQWEREIIKYAKKVEIMYRAPCGRRIRSMYEIRDYLRITQCKEFTVENFSFDIEIQVLSIYKVKDPKECPLYIEDITDGKEAMKIPAVNAFDNQRPPSMRYTAVRKPVGFKINTDPAFMACCDCEDDDCADKDKCACFQMTIKSAEFAARGDRRDGGPISYEWKRLLNQVSSGVYECHAGCKCSNKCLNKVVQHPIRVKMQMFRTKDKGWGLLACHDIPKGQFICVYAGKLYRDEDTEELCDNVLDGDEYFAELDLIESLAPVKEDFEPGVTYPDESEDEDDDFDDSDVDNDDDDTNFAGGRAGRLNGDQNRRRSTRSKKNKSKKSTSSRPSISNNNGEDGDDEIMPSQDNYNMEAPTSAAEAFRRLHGEGHQPYIMDAKHEGNIGRYFNHSCSPNLFVQNVFVDTHDMRFPWIAFFASQNIKAGEELTWNYNYTVGDVPNKVLYCKCGAPNCKKRIL